MISAVEMFKMLLNTEFTDSRLKIYSQPYDELVLSCTFAGKSCSKSAIGNHSTFRTYDFGLCYVFDPNKHDGISPSGEVSSSGQRYGLEILLNVDQNQSIPVVTSSSGVLIVPLYDVSKSLDADSGVFVPTGFQANIAVSKSETERVPGKNNESPMCDVSSDTTVHDCLSECHQVNIARRCGCSQHYIRSSHVNKTMDKVKYYRPCKKITDYECILKALDEFTNSTPSECRCISPCREELFTPDVTLMPWPNKKSLPILKRIIWAKLQAGKMRLDRNSIRDNFVLVRIYLKTLSYEVIKESYSYEIANFISDIGGQLGLWLGFSVFSILELVELVFLLLTKKDKPTELVRDETGDKYIRKDTHIVELSDFD